MKTGRSLTELVEEIERQTETNEDYLVDARALRAEAGFSDVLLDVPVRAGDDGAEPNAMALTDHAHNQLAGRLGIPTRYYQTMRKAAPELCVANINHWLAEDDATRLVRTLDGRVRAYLSDRYRPLDNFTLAENLLPALHESGSRIVSCEVTETNLYVKAVSSRLTRDVRKGDAVQLGIVIRNSEVGAGSLAIEGMVYRLVCENGMIVGRKNAGLRHAHLGAQLGKLEGDAARMLSDEANAATNRAIWLQAADVIRQSVDPALLDQITQQLAGAADDRITGDPAKAVKTLARSVNLTEREQTGVLRHLVAGGDGLNRYGLLNAVTRASQDVESYDRATELEEAGGAILDLPRAQWDRIATAA